MNAVLVVSNRQGVVGRVRDQDLGEAPSLRVFQVCSSQASELATVLGDIVGAEVGGVPEDVDIPPGCSGGGQRAARAAFADRSEASAPEGRGADVSLPMAASRPAACVG